MARLKVSYKCQQCGASTPRWAGRCASCDAWNCMEEDVSTRPGLVEGTQALPNFALLADVVFSSDSRMPTSVDELDRVLSGGLVPGGVTVLGGEPGIGKSTLVLQALAGIVGLGGGALLVSAEESPAQVALRSTRLGTSARDLWISAEASISKIEALTESLSPSVVVVDSIQTVFDPDLAGAPGSLTQVRSCAHRMVVLAKRLGVAVVLVGHVTKDGMLAGPKALEHMVDTVLAFEGERHHALRILRAVKHRFGTTGEIGIFEMTERGLLGISDPSAMLLGDRRPGVPGAVVVPAMEGRRSLMVELQALLVPGAGTPRRTAQGLDSSRMALVLAVLERYVGIPLSRFDVFASAVGGVRVLEPACDLPLALALASAISGTPVPPDVVACGEVGLGGEIRQVAQTQRRLSEAARVGFRRAVVARSAPDPPAGVQLVRVGDLKEALAAMGLASPGPVTPIFSED